MFVVKWVNRLSRLQEAQDVVYPIGSHESSFSTSEDSLILDHTASLLYWGLSVSETLWAVLCCLRPITRAKRILILGSPAVTYSKLRLIVGFNAHRMGDEPKCTRLNHSWAGMVCPYCWYSSRFWSISARRTWRQQRCCGFVLTGVPRS